MDITEAESGVMPLKRENTSIAELLANVIDVYQLVAEEKRITITAKLDSPSTAVVDAVRMRQVFGNLVDNALKYTADGGAVTVTCRSDLSRVLVEFNDTGMGISTEEQPRIWARLYRGDKSRSQRGLGLGLSLVKAIVEAHHGTVSVQSEIGVGSQFTVTLPVT
jgi:signal transduction histidine kinase